jgi:hypothetical protein
MLTPHRERELRRRLRLYERGILDHREAERAFARLARPGDLDELLRRTPPQFAGAIREAAARFRPFRSVGYWKGVSDRHEQPEDRFPDPADLVSPGWAGGDRDAIVAYLRAGRTFIPWRGHSYCRFRCGIDRTAMGSRCLTDGEWVWPEGLAHYVEVHEVRLPDEFVDGMRRRGWRIPEECFPAYEPFDLPDDEFWLAWSNQRLA